MTTNVKESVTRCRDANHDRARARAWALLRHEIDFIPNAEFQAESNDETLTLEQILGPTSGVTAAPRDLPAHLARLCEVPLLSPEQERELFRQMNYLKFRANCFRATLNPDDPNQPLMDRIEKLLHEAQTSETISFRRTCIGDVDREEVRDPAAFFRRHAQRRCFLADAGCRQV